MTHIAGTDRFARLTELSAIEDDFVGTRLTVPPGTPRHDRLTDDLGRVTRARENEISRLLDQGLATGDEISGHLNSLGLSPKVSRQIHQAAQALAANPGLEAG